MKQFDDLVKESVSLVEGGDPVVKSLIEVAWKDCLEEVASEMRFSLEGNGHEVKRIDVASNGGIVALVDGQKYVSFFTVR